MTFGTLLCALACRIGIEAPVLWSQGFANAQKRWPFALRHQTVCILVRFSTVVTREPYLKRSASLAPCHALQVERWPAAPYPSFPLSSKLSSRHIADLQAKHDLGSKCSGRYIIFSDPTAIVVSASDT